MMVRSGTGTVLVTGARGKVGSRVVAALIDAGHDVLATDISSPMYDNSSSDQARYIQADLTCSGDAFEVVSGVEIVVNAAAIPEPSKNTSSTVWTTNTSIAWNVTDAAVRCGSRRLINISSDSVAGMTWAHVPFVAEYCPIDEEHPDSPQDVYGLSKQVSEVLCESFVQRTGGSAVSIRPTWVMTAETYERNLGPLLADRSLTTAVFWSYVDVEDLAALVVRAVEVETAGHEVVYAAAADNIGSRDLRNAVEVAYPGLPCRPLIRPDASGISSAKAHRLFGWTPCRSWSDHLRPDGTSLG